jgi:hypothetical protein
MVDMEKKIDELTKFVVNLSKKLEDKDVTITDKKETQVSNG